MRGASRAHPPREQQAAPHSDDAVSRANRPSSPKAGASAATAERAPRSAARAPGSVEQSPHVTLGVPTDRDSSDDYLMDEQEYVLSYNPERRGPNWVSWKLDASDLGHVPRATRFRSNAELPGEFYRVTPGDYQNTNYDRGHLCPSADRDDTRERNERTFLMTNVLPQLHELNAGPWERLEQHERDLAHEPDSQLFIVAGGIFEAACPTIGHKVAVPKATYKIIVVLRRGQRPSDVTRDTRVIAVMMPNTAGVGEHAWTDFATSVDAIEQASGYDFLARVPDAIENAIEARRF
jgi:endonuclease G